MNISRNILNEAIDLSLEWGNNPKERLHMRIHKLYPELSKQQALEIEKLCRDVHKYTSERAKSATSARELVALIAERYNFINDSNREGLSRQAWFWKP